MRIQINKLPISLTVSKTSDLTLEMPFCGHRRYIFDENDWFFEVFDEFIRKLLVKHHIH